MSQKTRGIYRLTQIPSVYAAIQSLLRAADTHQVIASEFIRPNPGDRVLDIGCGSAPLLPYLGNVSYTGIDLNPLHIARATELYSDRATFHCGGFAEVSTRLEDDFDLIMCIGILHHLDDEEIDELGRFAGATLSDRGKLVCIDPAFVKGQNLFARWMAKRDSGQNVRTPEGYVTCLSRYFGHIDVEVRHDMLKIPYTHSIVTAKLSPYD